MVIRFAGFQDAEGVLAIYAPVVIGSAASFETEVPSVEEMAARIAATLPQRPWLVCVHSNGGVLGYAYAAKHRQRSAYRWSIEPSVYVDPHRHGRGIGRALYAALFDILRLQGYCNAYAGIALPNPASIHLHEACGFKEVGVYRRVGFKLGVWHDVGWYHLTLRDCTLNSPPSEVKTVSELQADQRLASVLQAATQCLTVHTPRSESLRGHG